MTAIADFAGDVVAITGARTGLAGEYSAYLATRGASVVVDDDVDADAGEQLVSRVIATYGRLDAFINAGIWPSTTAADQRLTATSDGDVRSVIDAQLLATISSTRAALRFMEQRGSGRVVVTTSGAGAFGLAGTAIQSAADAALIGLTHALGLDAARSQIRINAIAPLADSGAADDYFCRFPQLDRDRYTAASVVPVVAYLCHRDCALQGAVLTAGGGRVARIATLTGAGQFIDGSDHTVIARKLEKILAMDHAMEPRSALDEILMIEV